MWVYVNRPRFLGSRIFYNILIALDLVVLVFLLLIWGHDIALYNQEPFLPIASTLAAEVSDMVDQANADAGKGKEIVPSRQQTAVYDGPFSKPVKIDEDLDDATSSIQDESDAYGVLKTRIDPTVAIRYTGYTELGKGLYGYNYIQTYGPLKVFNAKLQVVCDYWGNLKGVNGRYAVLRGSITAEDLDVLRGGSEYGILLGKSGYAKTVVSNGKTYHDRKSGAKVTAKDIELDISGFMGPVKWRWTDGDYTQDPS